MTHRCPHCGASYADDDDCQCRFDQALAAEFTDAAYGAVHHLTVTAFMLQHNRYSHDGWLAALELLAAFLEDRLDPRQAERRTARRWKSVSRGEPFSRFAEITWTRTIADVRIGDAEVYRADISAWAEAVLADSQAVAGGARKA